MNKILTIASLILTLALSACGGGDTFRINGEVEGLGTRSLKFYYYDGDRLKTGMATALDGKFQYEGKAGKPVIVHLATAQGIPVGNMIVENGDAINVKFFSDKPGLMEISGNSAAEKYASFLKENYPLVAAGPSGSLDIAVEKFIAANPRNIASAVVLSLHYDIARKPAAADSLLKTLDTKFRPGQLTAGYTAIIPRFTADSLTVIQPVRLYSAADSMTTVDPAASPLTLFIFYDSRALFDTAMRDSLSRLHDHNVAIINISLARDTAIWKEQLRDKPAKGTDLWMPGAVSAPALRQFNLNTLPAFAVVDSVGTLLYKGDSFDNALEPVHQFMLETLR
ncbi:MAG: DUF4369 domain-containing protein [Muribaculaceae bacterium]|nr:DUF4369 domain-containing protein [Muribaculaceae bacterium]